MASATRRALPALATSARHYAIGKTALSAENVNHNSHFLLLLILISRLALLPSDYNNTDPLFFHRDSPD